MLKAYLANKQRVERTWYGYKLMQKNKSHLGDSRAIKEYSKEGEMQALPSIDPRKNSSPFEDQLRNQFRKLVSNDQLEQSNRNRD